MGRQGIITIFPSKASDHVESFSFESPLEGLDSASIRARFLDLVDSLTAQLGPPTGWGLAGLYKKERVLPLGILETVWRKAAISGDRLALQVRQGELELSVRSAAYQARLEEESRTARLRWEAEERREGPVVDPNHVYETWQVQSPPLFRGCQEKAPRTGYRGELTITAVVAPWGKLWPRASLATLDLPSRARNALEDWINQDCRFVGGLIDGTFVYSRIRFTVEIDG